MDDATLRDVTGDFVAFAVEGPKADELLQSFFQVNLSSLPAHGHTEVHWKPENTSVSLLVVARSQAGLPGAVLLVPQVHGLRLMCALVKAVSQFGGTIIGWEALNALRLESGIPWFGYDFDERTIPHEAGLEISHISYTKGCYTGQEIVERVRSRGHVNRRLTRLKFSGAVNPAAGTKLFASEKEIGHVTSAAFSPAMGQPIGLGFVRREHIAHGTRLAWEGGEAEVFVAG
jgi:aminomethyltransferase